MLFFVKVVIFNSLLLYINTFTTGDILRHPWSVLNPLTHHSPQTFTSFWKSQWKSKIETQFKRNTLFVKHWGSPHKNKGRLTWGKQVELSYDTKRLNVQHNTKQHYYTRWGFICSVSPCPCPDHPGERQRSNLGNKHTLNSFLANFTELLVLSLNTGVHRFWSLFTGPN